MCEKVRRRAIRDWPVKPPMSTETRFISKPGHTGFVLTHTSTPFKEHPCNSVIDRNLKWAVSQTSRVIGCQCGWKRSK
jgi:hypothetical protein